MLPLADQLPAIAIEPGWAPSSGAIELPRGLHQLVLLLDQTSEVLSVHGLPCECFNNFLQSTQGEGLRHHLEDHRAILQHAAQSGESGRQDPPMVVQHRPPRIGLPLGTRPVS